MRTARFDGRWRRGPPRTVHVEWIERMRKRLATERAGAHIYVGKAINVRIATRSDGFGRGIQTVEIERIGMLLAFILLYPVVLFNRAREAVKDIVS
jgi:hypothetical protein